MASVEQAPRSAPRSEEPPPASARSAALASRALARRLGNRSATLRCTLAAAGAWAISVGPLIITGRAGLACRAAAALALLPAVLGPQLIGRSHRYARHVGVTAFLALSLLAWALASLDLALGTVDTFRGILGVLAWAVFALSWSHPWGVPDDRLKSAPEGDTSGLSPRRRPPGYAVVVAVAGLLGALACLFAAWTIQEQERAVLGQAMAVACAVALVTAASTVAVIAGKEQARKGTAPRLPIDRSVINALVLLIVIMGMAIGLYVSA